MKSMKIDLQLFGTSENEAMEGFYDLMTDHEKSVCDMSDEAIAMLEIASRIESLSVVLYSQLVEVNEKLEELIKTKKGGQSNE